MSHPIFSVSHDKLLHYYSEADLEGGGGAVRPLKFAKHICYTTLFKQFNKQRFHEWLTRDL